MTAIYEALRAAIYQHLARASERNGTFAEIERQEADIRQALQRLLDESRPMAGAGCETSHTLDPL